MPLAVEPEPDPLSSPPHAAAAIARANAPTAAVIRVMRIVLLL
jgi:hypothetical protein